MSQLPGGRIGSKRRRALWLTGGGFVLLAFVFNLVAWNQARAMLHFAPAREGQEGLRRDQVLLDLILGVTAYRPENRTTPESFGLRFQTHRITTRDDAGIELWEIPCNDARAAMILFHGYAASKSSVLAQARAFHEMQCACYLVDFRGGGGSDGNDTTLGYREAADVAAAMKFVRARHPETKVALYGSSMGAAAVLRAVHVEKVTPDAIILESVFDRMLTTVANRFRAMHLPAFPAARTLVFWGSVDAGFWAFDHNPMEYAGSVGCPALVLQGGLDSRARPDDARRVYTRLPKNSRWELFPGAGHEPLLNRDPTLWRGAVGELLGDMEKAPALP